MFLSPFRHLLHSIEWQITYQFKVPQSSFLLYGDDLLLNLRDQESGRFFLSK